MSTYTVHRGMVKTKREIMEYMLRAIGTAVIFAPIAIVCFLAFVCLVLALVPQLGLWFERIK